MYYTIVHFYPYSHALPPNYTLCSNQFMLTIALYQTITCDEISISESICTKKLDIDLLNENLKLLGIIPKYKEKLRFHVNSG